MNPNELCQKLRITEKQLSKICHHLRIINPDEMVGEFTPEEIEHLQSFVAKKRSTGRKSSDNKLINKKDSPVSVVLSKHSNSVQVSPQPNIVVNLPAETSVSVGLRACAYIIDCLVTFVFSPLVFVPILGLMLIGILLFFYWLLRDIGGSSLGKLVLGLQVVNHHGNQHSLRPRIVRNILFSIGPMFLCIPLVGIFIGAPITILMILIEVIMLLATGSRIGDRLAGTSVEKVPKVRFTSE